MKLSKLVVMSIAGLAIVSCGGNKNSSSESKSSTSSAKMDSISYALGVSTSSQLTSMKTGLEKDFGLVINLPAYFEGHDNVVDSTSMKFNDDKAKTVLNAFFAAQKELAEKRKETDTKPEALPISKDASLKTVMDSVSYALGLKNGLSVIYMRDNIKKGLGLDVNLQAFKEGYKKGGDSLSLATNRNLLDNFFKKKQDELDQKAKKVGEDFLKENKSKEGVKTTESGLQYIVLKEGTGKIPTKESVVKVHYHGTLIDGKVFDSSVDRKQPAEFGVSQVIKGWTEGLQLMKVGSKFKFFIPQELGYGDRPAGALIKAFSTLVFEVELLEIKEPEVEKVENVAPAKLEVK